MTDMTDDQLLGHERAARAALRRLLTQAAALRRHGSERHHALDAEAADKRAELAIYREALGFPPYEEGLA